MNIIIKTDKEIEIMRKGGKILAGILKELSSEAREGVSTYELDSLANDLCKKNKVKPGFLGYRGYPATICIGVNEVVVHGIPSKDEILKEGDIVSIDMGIIYKGYYSDCAVTVGIGNISKEAERLINTTRDCLYAAIRQAKAGNTIGDIGYAIQSVAELANCNVVRRMVGHGIGKNLHEDPQVPGFGIPKKGIKLESGLTIAIEAIINQGGGDIRFEKDGWTTKTADSSLSALFEHSIVVKKNKAEILTKL